MTNKNYWIKDHPWLNKVVMVRKNFKPAYIGKCTEVCRTYGKLPYDTFYIEFIANLGNYKFDEEKYKDHTFGIISMNKDIVTKIEHEKYVRPACVESCDICQYKYICFTVRKNEDTDSNTKRNTEEKEQSCSDIRGWPRKIR